MTTDRTGKTFPIRTLRDLYELPTLDMMERALEELSKAMVSARAMEELLVATAIELARADGCNVEGLAGERGVTWPEVTEWTDDKGVPSSAVFVEPSGEELMTLSIPAT